MLVACLSRLSKCGWAISFINVLLPWLDQILAWHVSAGGVYTEEVLDTAGNDLDRNDYLGYSIDCDEFCAVVGEPGEGTDDPTRAGPLRTAGIVPPAQYDASQPGQ